MDMDMEVLTMDADDMDMNDMTMDADSSAEKQRPEK